RLNREALLWRTLKHPNVLEFFGIVHNMGSFFGLVSPYCEKGPVANYLDDNPQTDRLDLILGVAKGIEYLHEKDVIHGDIKGSNVLIADDGRPLLCDFGRSKITNHQGHTTTSPTGSLRYMAPELISHNTDESDYVQFLIKATDVYGFSMLTVKILSGQEPYPKIRNEFRITFKVPEGLRPIREDYQLSVLHEKIWDILELC
ncbi:kinase-like domain-containing protein, partial [Amanita rubescens]